MKPKPLYFFVIAFVILCLSLFWGSWLISHDIVWGRGAIAFMWMMGLIAGWRIGILQKEFFG